MLMDTEDDFTIIVKFVGKIACGLIDGLALKSISDKSLFFLTPDSPLFSLQSPLSPPALPLVPLMMPALSFRLSQTS